MKIKKYQNLIAIWISDVPSIYAFPNFAYRSVFTSPSKDQYQTIWSGTDQYYFLIFALADIDGTSWYSAQYTDIFLVR